MLRSITINTPLVQKFFFSIGCKGDPQKPLLKAASMRATVKLIDQYFKIWLTEESLK